MKNFFRCSLLWLLPATVLFLPACRKPAATRPTSPPADTKSEAKRFPLIGVVIEVRTATSELLVRHDAIAGLMPGMTMAFKVDATTLKAVTKNEAITATLVVQGDDFHLENVQPFLKK